MRCFALAVLAWISPAATAADESPHAPDTAPMPVVAAGADRGRPDIRPLLSIEDRQAALQEGKRLRELAPVPASAPAASSVPTPAPALAPTPAPTPPKPGSVRSTAATDTTPAKSAPPPAAETAPPAAAAAKSPAPPASPPVPVAGTAYALVTEVTRSRLASELRQQLMGSSSTVGELPGAPHTELMQVSNGWRAVVWPFATEGEAAKARRMLAARGIRTEVLKF